MVVLVPVVSPMAPILSLSLLVPTPIINVLMVLAWRSVEVASSDGVGANFPV